MESVIIFTTGIVLGAIITIISHKLGSQTYENAVHFIMAPQVPEGDNVSSSKDYADEGIYDFQAPEDILRMYDGVQIDTPDDEEGKEPNNNEFEELN